MWGLGYEIQEALDAGSPICWGARAIWGRGQTPDLLWDRQGMYLPEGIEKKEEERRRKALGKLLDGKRLATAWKNIPSYLDGSSDEDVVLLEDSEVRIVASPNGSFGYLYIAAVKKGDTI